MPSWHRTTLLILLLCASGFAFAGNLIPNAGFTSFGAAPGIGVPVLSCAPSGGLSAAADWFTFIPDPLSCVTTTIFPSTDNLPGATGPNMLEFTTNAGFNGSAGNGVFSVGPALPANTVGHVDIFVPASSGDIGFVVNGCCFSSGTFSFTPTIGWNRVTFSNPEGPSGEFGLEIFSQGGGTIYIANPFASPAPEPGSLILLGTGLAFVASKLRRRR